MREVIQRPDASSILSSLRSVGYSFDTAVADIVDNSISADARTVELRLEQEDDEPIFSIIDDGHGMSRGELINAMRYGGNGTRHLRAAGDLGRYGLGLKTASLSQCRQLTVVTKTNIDEFSAARWDLDVVELRNEWILTLPNRTDLRKLSVVRELLRREKGTVVIWRSFDLALGGARDKVAALQTLLDECREHLALTFHRFLQGGDAKPTMTILLNGLNVDGKDPFLESNPRTQKLPTEKVRLQGRTVSITGMILPQTKNMTATELESLGGINGLKSGQGFYIYRNKRLIIAGTWFRILRFDDLTKLARVRIDIPNDMDDLWNLDIKKSTASPPDAVRQVLKRIIDRIAVRSFTSFKGRQSKSARSEPIPVWLRKALPEGVTYKLNRDHPSFSDALDTSSGGNGPLIESALKIIELSVPYATILSDLNGGVSFERNSIEVQKTLNEILSEWIRRCGNDRIMRTSLLQALPSVEPFSRYPEVTQHLLQAASDGK